MMRDLGILGPQADHREEYTNGCHTITLRRNGRRLWQVGRWLGDPDGAILLDAVNCSTREAAYDYFDDWTADS